jgi:ketosteroid isomerase-like protein/quercetin dioxygenase-like cupin family protein
MRKLLLVVSLVSLPLFAQDAAKVGPDVYKCILENDMVRVCEVTFKPGASVAVHSHPQHLVYVITPGKLKITPVGAAPVEVDFKPGQAVWSPAETHSAINAGKTELRGLVVELKEAQDPVAAAIMNMEKEWMEAMLAGNAAKIGTFLADDWVFTDPGGQRMTRTQMLDDFRSGALKIESSVPGEVKVNVYGDTAIVNGSSKDKGTYKGMDISGDYVFTDVFVKRDGQWRAVSSAVTRVMPMQ